MVLQVMDENRQIRDHVPQMVGDSLISDRFDNRKRLQICVGQFLVNAKGNFQDFEESFMFQRVKIIFSLTNIKPSGSVALPSEEEVDSQWLCMLYVSGIRKDVEVLLGKHPPKYLKTK